MAPSTFPRTPPTPDAADHTTLWDGLVALLTRMLARDPTQRATVGEVRKALQSLGAANRVDSLVESMSMTCRDAIKPNASDVHDSISLATRPAVGNSVRARLSASVTLRRPDDFTPPASPCLVPTPPQNAAVTTPHAPRTPHKRALWGSGSFEPSAVLCDFTPPASPCLAPQPPRNAAGTTAHAARKQRSSALWESGSFEGNRPPHSRVCEPNDAEVSVMNDPGHTASDYVVGHTLFTPDPLSTEPCRNVGRVRTHSTFSDRPHLNAAEGQNASAKTTAEAIDLCATVPREYPFAYMLVTAWASFDM